MKNLYYKNNYKHKKTFNKRLTNIFSIIDNLHAINLVYNKRYLIFIEDDTIPTLKTLLKKYCNQSNIKHISNFFNKIKPYPQLFLIIVIPISAIKYFNLSFEKIINNIINKYNEGKYE